MSVSKGNGTKKSVNPRPSEKDEKITEPLSTMSEISIATEGVAVSANEKGEVIDKLSEQNSTKGYEKIKRFREKAGLEPYSISSGNTVACIEIDGKNYFGVNSTITQQSKANTRELREKWLNEIEWVPPKKRAPQHLGHAQSLTHAEAHSLIRAYEKQGKLPKKITMYVDRKTCNICRGELPCLLKRLGVEELTVFSGGTSKPIIIKAVK